MKINCFFTVLFLLLLSRFAQSTSTARERTDHPVHRHAVLSSSAGQDTLLNFPFFNYSDTTGRKYTLNNLKGKKRTLVVFWASWCVPCRKEIPELKALYQECENKGLSIVSISVDQNISAWKKAVKEEKMAWTNIANLPSDGVSMSDRFGVTAVPTAFLIDDKGHILLTDPGVEEVRENLKKQL